jgi:hypothetical protein
MPRKLRLIRAVCGSLLTGLLGLGGNVSTGTAQSCPSASTSEARQLAERYAPILSFGTGESYFPTIPFFTAFDSLAGRKDFGDSARIAPFVVDGKLSWDSLEVAYHARLDAKSRRHQLFEPQFAAVFYRVRCLEGKKNKQLWGFLRNDNQAWKRTGLDTLYAQGLKDAQFAVVEYYLYYVRDAGLQGHPHDLERILVFVPRSIPEERLMKQALPPSPGKQAALFASLAVMVGTGHTQTTANNIVVLVGGQARGIKNPAFLIELGGHSSAPDLNGDYAFEVGLDVNWNLTGRIWGTRDVQAVSGLGALGEYESWMTLSRDPCISATLAPEGIGALDAILPAQTRAPGASTSCSALRNGAPQVIPTIYSLLPVEPFYRMDRQVEGIDHARTALDSIDRFDSVRTAIDDEIKPLLEPRWGFLGFSDTSQAKILEAMHAMRYWRTINASGRTRIWDHPDFTGSPIRSLKRRLYRPTATGLQNVGDYVSLLYAGVTAYTGNGGWQTQVGVVVPATGLVPIPGVLEVQVGRYYGYQLFKGKSRYSVSVLYERQYRGLTSYYIRPIDYVHRRSELEGGSAPADFTMGAGVSVMPFFPFPDKPIVGPLLSQRFRLRGGVRIDIGPSMTPRLGRFEFQGVFYVR